MNTSTNTSTSCGCSCGASEAHVIARRATFDGYTIAVWSDGALTVRGIGNPRNQWSRVRRAIAVRLVMDDFGVFDLEEISRLIRSAEKTCKYTWASVADQRIAAVRGVRA